MSDVEFPVRRTSRRLAACCRETNGSGVGSGPRRVRLQDPGSDDPLGRGPAAAGALRRQAPSAAPPWRRAAPPPPAEANGAPASRGRRISQQTDRPGPSGGATRAVRGARPERPSAIARDGGRRRRGPPRALSVAGPAASSNPPRDAGRSGRAAACRRRRSCRREAGLADRRSGGRTRRAGARARSSPATSSAGSCWPARSATPSRPVAALAARRRAGRRRRPALRTSRRASCFCACTRTPGEPAPSALKRRSTRRTSPRSRPWTTRRRALPGEPPGVDRVMTEHGEIWMRAQTGNVRGDDRQILSFVATPRARASRSVGRAQGRRQRRAARRRRVDARQRHATGRKQPRCHRLVRTRCRSSTSFGALVQGKVVGIICRATDTPSAHVVEHVPANFPRQTGRGHRATPRRSEACIEPSRTGFRVGAPSPATCIRPNTQTSPGPTCSRTATSCWICCSARGTDAATPCRPRRPTRLRLRSTGAA